MGATPNQGDQGRWPVWGHTGLQTYLQQDQELAFDASDASDANLAPRLSRRARCEARTLSGLGRKAQSEIFQSRGSRTRAFDSPFDLE